MRMRSLLIAGLLLSCSLLGAADMDRPTLKLWPEVPPDETKKLPPEANLTKTTENNVGGKPIIRLGNVSTPILAVYRPDPKLANGTAVVICPGGGHHILAWDLEGTEVAEWLNSLGVTAFVLKYRVPFRHPDRRWLSAVQDAQRAVSLVRQQADTWKIDPKRIGILGFSAGGETAARAALMAERQYKAIDATDAVSSRPDFAVLVYPAYLMDPKTNQLREDIPVTDKAPPTFLAHAANDPVTVESSLLLALALKRAKVPAEVHTYATGGHGYGLRRTKEPCTTWPDRCETWLRHQGLLGKEKE